MTFGQNLLDTIAVLIGFIAVMLLLSLLNTALVQATQAIIRLRGRNLQNGIRTLMYIVQGENKKHKDWATDILNARNLSIKITHKFKNKFTSWIAGSAVSYIDPKELPNVLDSLKKDIGEKSIEELKSGISKYWERVEKYMEKRFLFLIRLLSISMAVLIAFYFQVSTPDLLHKLSIDPDLREKYVTLALNMDDKMEAELSEVLKYQDVSGLALQRLEARYPKLKEKLEEVSGIGKDKNSLIEELRMVLEDDVSDAIGIIKSYEEILDELYKEKMEKNLEQARNAMQMVGKFNIRPWQYGTGFYYRKGKIQSENIVGILFTAVLLSFGASFWYNRLREVLKLRDVLSRITKPKGNNNTREGRH